tara:strand:- start:122 stop:328 length:207 start_codon:yes stop_codon:yes gene_type:complete
MPQRTLRFRIRQDGLVEESVEGVLGESCQLLTEKLESSLGEVQQRVATPEAYLNSEVQTQSISAQQAL